MNIVTKILPLIAVAAACVFFWPTPRPNPDRVYAKVPKEKVAALTGFRKEKISKQIKVDGKKWDYLSVGSGPNTILFLHGMTGAYDIWWQQIQALKGEYRVIALTYPAVNKLAALEKGVLAVLDAEGVKDCYLVGTSLGGYLAQYLVARHPERVAKAVFSNTFPPNDLLKEKNGKIGALIPFLPEWVVMKVLRGSFVERVYPASGNDELTLAFLNEVGSGRMSKEQVNGRYKCVVEKFEPAANTSVPILIIEASNDPLVEGALREQLKRTYPNAKTVTVDNGHFPYLGRPDAFNATIKTFFEETL
ncbi:MAG: alpha/beta hydrolase [Treponemataceae bacterium]